MTNEPAKTTDLVVTHTFDAPVEKVWRVWTEEKFVERWWRVDGFSNILAKMDVREGSRSHVGCVPRKNTVGRITTTSLNTHALFPKN